MPVYRGISTDWDGSFSPKDSTEDVISVNINILTSLKDENSKYAGTKVYVGSNRQGDFDDISNAAQNGNGSCYPQIQRISEYLDAEFDDFLLADVYNNLESGETLKRALTHLYSEQNDYDPEIINKITLLDWLHDTSKLSLLIAQIQKLASEHPDDDIEFYFFDDKKVILDALGEFFSIPENCQLLPRNLKALHLIPYPSIKADDGMDSFVSYAPIIGTGDIDFNYRQTVKSMAAACIESAKFQESYPSSSKEGRPVKKYEQAENTGFRLTSDLNCVRDYKFGMKPEFPPNPEPEELKKLSYPTPQKKPSSKRFFHGVPSFLKLSKNSKKEKKREQEKDKDGSKGKEKEQKKEKKVAENKKNIKSKKENKKSKFRFGRSKNNSRIDTGEAGASNLPIQQDRFFKVQITKPDNRKALDSLATHRDTETKLN